MSQWRPAKKCAARCSSAEFECLNLSGFPFFLSDLWSLSREWEMTFVLLSPRFQTMLRCASFLLYFTLPLWVNLISWWNGKTLILESVKLLNLWPPAVSGCGSVLWLCTRFLPSVLLFFFCFFLVSFCWHVSNCIFNWLFYPLLHFVLCLNHYNYYWCHLTINNLWFWVAVAQSMSGVSVLSLPMLFTGGFSSSCTGSAQMPFLLYRLQLLTQWAARKWQWNGLLTHSLINIYDGTLWSFFACFCRISGAGVLVGEGDGEPLLYFGEGSWTLATIKEGSWWQVSSLYLGQLFPPGASL